MDAERVLVLGATGRTGQRAVWALLARGVAVRALVRDPARAEALLPPEVELRAGSPLDAGVLGLALVGCDAALDVLGVPDPGRPEGELAAVEAEVPAQLGALAAVRRLGRVVLCSSLGVERPEALPMLAPVLRAKRRGELGLMAAHSDVVIVRPGGLTDTPGGEGVRCARHLPGFGRISREDTARVLVAALFAPGARGPYEVIADPACGPAERPGLFGEG